MKNTIFLAVLAAICIGSASCSKEISEEFSDVKLKEVTISVSSTKLTLKTGDVVNWSKGDKISVFNGTNPSDAKNQEGGYQFTANSSGADVSFTGSIPEGITDMTGWIAYCSYNKKNTYDGTNLICFVPNTYSDNSKIYPSMVGVFFGNGVAMKQLGSLVAFTLSSSDITSVRIRGNNDEYLAGYPTITFDGSGNPVSAVVEDEKAQYGSVIFSNSEGLAPGTYYFPVVPADFTKGLTLTFTDKTDKTIYAEKVGVRALNLSRAGIKSLGTVDTDLKWEKSVQFTCIDFPTKGAFGPVWPFNEDPAISTSASDVKTFTTKIEGAAFKAVARGFCANTTKSGQGVKMGDQVGDYLEFPSYSGFGLRKVVIWSSKNGNGTRQCEYCLKNGSSVIGENWINPTRGASHTWIIDNPQETPYRFEIVNTGDNFTIQRMYLYYKSLSSSGVKSVTTSFASEYLKATDSGTATLPGSFTTDNFDKASFECGIEYRVYKSGSQWTSVSASSVALNFTAVAKGLTDYERYEYRAWAKPVSGDKVYGETRTFTLSDSKGTIRMDITLASDKETDGSYYNRFVTEGKYLPTASSKSSQMTAEESFELPSDKDQMLGFSIFSKSGYGYGYRTASSKTLFHGLSINYNDTNLGYLKLPEIPDMKLYGVAVKFRDKGTVSSLHSSVNATTCAGSGLIEQFDATGDKNEKKQKFNGTDKPWDTSVYLCAESKAVTVTYIHLRYIF